MSFCRNRLKHRDVLGPENYDKLQEMIERHGQYTSLRQEFEDNHVTFTVLNPEHQPLEELTFEMNGLGPQYLKEHWETLTRVFRKRGLIGEDGGGGQERSLGVFLACVHVCTLIRIRFDEVTASV